MTHLGRLVDHTECWRDVRKAENERDDLRLELATLRAENAKLKAELEGMEISLAIEECANQW